MICEKKSPQNNSFFSIRSNNTLTNLKSHRNKLAKELQFFMAQTTQRREGQEEDMRSIFSINNVPPNVNY